MRCFFLLILTITLINCPTFSQDWIEVGGGTDNEIRVLYADSVHHELYSGGDFEYAGSVLVNKIAKWDHVSWDSLGPGAFCLAGSWVSAITSFRDTLIAAGCFFNQWPYDFYIAKWNGAYWDSLGSGVNYAVESLKVISDTLYVGGYFDHADTIATNLLAKWDGRQWLGCSLPLEANGNRIYEIEEYQGHIYICGKFWDSTNVWISNIARIENNQLFPVGTALSNPSNFDISSLVVYDGELYIAGAFGTGNTGLGSNIIKWDGTDLSTVDGGVNYYVTDMTIFNNELYVVGQFDSVGSIQAQYIARWDGISWHSVGNSVFDSPISAITVYDNELYVAGGFTAINGQNINRIAKYIGPLTVSESENIMQINAFPNPAQNSIKLVSEHLKIQSLSFRDILNHEIAHFNVNAAEFSYDTQNLQAGVYFLQIETEKGRVVKKFVKE